MSDRTATKGVAQIVHGWPPESIGGTELYAQALQRGLANHGLSSVAFVRSAMGSKEGRVQDSAEVRRVTLTSKGVRRLEHTWARPDVAAHFRAWLSIHQPRVAHFHHLTWLSTDLPRVARESGALVVFTLHDYWLFCARGQLVNHEGERCVGPSPSRCAVCLGGHTALNPATATLGRAATVLPQALRTALRELLPRPDLQSAAKILERRSDAVSRLISSVHRFTAPSEHMVRRAIAFGVPKQRIERFDLALVHPIAEAPDPGSGPVRFLFVGTLLPTKGVARLVEAFSRLPSGSATLTLIGPIGVVDTDPGFQAALHQQVKQLPHARILPPFAPGEADAIYAQADVFVLPSIWEENSPLVLREAQAAGLRVIASDIGGIPEIAPKARLVDPDDEDALHAALQAESREGRRRNPPQPAADPSAHSADMMSAYRRWAIDARVEPICD